MDDSTPGRDPDGDDRRNILPPAPLPPHERTWRHPSEIADSMRHDLATPVSFSSVGRGVTA